MRPRFLCDHIREPAVFDGAPPVDHGINIGRCFFIAADTMKDMMGIDGLNSGHVGFDGIAKDDIVNGEINAHGVITS